MPHRVTDVSSDHSEPHVLINPVILEKDGVAVTEEGCLSVPGYYEEVERAEHIRVSYLDRDGAEQTMEARGLLAVCIQHEIDHLDGKLFVEKTGGCNPRRPLSRSLYAVARPEPIKLIS